MRPLLQHASRSFFAEFTNLSTQPSSRAALGSFLKASETPLTCLRCQFGTISTLSRRSDAQVTFSPFLVRFSRRQISSSSVRSEKDQPLTHDASQTTPRSPQTNNVNSTTSDSPLRTGPIHVEDTVARVPAEDLPSHRERQRWNFSKRMSDFMDEVLPKLAIVTHKVNTYTGTDYSSIEALRQEIREQEQLVKSRRLAIDEAKQSFDIAHAQQATSQKEVVALLERKHSWSATDLERYMSLIRSEHVNDQAVREAKDAVLAAENALEEARTRLEKRERAQYHEEQIWSDTIRRNSTWVTFGLMGVNIFLLLTSLVLIEPWRRRRMVKEIKNALDAQTTAANAAIAPASASQELYAIEDAIDKVVEPAGSALEGSIRERSSTTAQPVVESGPLLPKEGEEGIKTVSDPLTQGGAVSSAEGVQKIAAIDIEEEISSTTKTKPWQEGIVATAKDLLSERSISMRKIDFTNAVLEGAAIGAVVTAVIIQIMTRP